MAGLGRYRKQDKVIESCIRCLIICNRTWRRPHFMRDASCNVRHSLKRLTSYEIETSQNLSAAQLLGSALPLPRGFRTSRFAPTALATYL